MQLAAGAIWTGRACSRAAAREDGGCCPQPCLRLPNRLRRHCPRDASLRSGLWLML